MSYDVGDTIAAAAEVRDENGELTNATGVVYTVTLPDGTTATPAVSNPSIGRYIADYVATMSGWHDELWTSTAPSTTQPGGFMVRVLHPRYIVSLDDAKRHLKLDADAVEHDEELLGFIEAVTEVIEELADEVVVRGTVVERKTIRGPRVALSHIPVISLTSVEAIDGSWTSGPAEWDVDPEAGILRALPGNTAACGDAIITTVAGYPVVPARYQTAALLLLARLWSTKRGTKGAPRTGGQPDAQEAMRLVTPEIRGLVRPALPGIA